MTEHPDPGVSLLGVRYGGQASDLWRWVDADEDEQVDRFVTAFTSLDETARHGIRARLGDAEMATLLTFAQRQALAAVRSRDVRHVVKAFEALSAIALSAVPDVRDLAMIGMLVTYSGQAVDDRIADVVAPAVARADAETAELLSAYLAEPVDLVESCGYRVVDSPSGRVFIEDEGELYQPRANLTAAAWPAADVLESDGYRVDRVGVGQQLNDLWLGGDPAAALSIARLTACAVVDSTARDRGGWHSVTVYLAEAASYRDAAAIASAADRVNDPRVPQFGIGVKELCAVVHARTPNVDDQPVEDLASLRRFRPAITAILERIAG